MVDWNVKKNKWMENPMKNTTKSTNSTNSAFHLGRFKKVIGKTVKPVYKGH